MMSQRLAIRVEQLSVRGFQRPGVSSFACLAGVDLVANGVRPKHQLPIRWRAEIGGEGRLRGVLSGTGQGDERENYEWFHIVSFLVHLPLYAVAAFEATADRRIPINLLLDTTLRRSKSTDTSS
jgi:hypothetical protein